jgi:hypothetical protein
MAPVVTIVAATIAMYDMGYLKSDKSNEQKKTSNNSINSTVEGSFENSDEN